MNNRLDMRPSWAIGSTQQRAIIELATSKGVSSDYIQAAFLRYRFVARLFRHKQLVAVEFYDTFYHNDHQYAYFGPLISIQGAYVSLFTSLVTRLVDTEHAFWGAMELENSMLLPVVQTLLGVRCYPHASSCISWQKAMEVFSVFTNQFKHIQGFDPLAFTTAFTQKMTSHAHELTDHQVVIFGCDGTLQDKAVLASHMTHFQQELLEVKTKR